MSSENKLSLTSVEERAKFIAENESSMYGGKNEEGEEVVVMLEKGLGMDVHTYQSNGWIRVDEYFEHGLIVGTTYKGRWDKE